MHDSEVFRFFPSRIPDSKTHANGVGDPAVLSSACHRSACLSSRPSHLPGPSTVGRTDFEHAIESNQAPLLLTWNADVLIVNWNADVFILSRRTAFFATAILLKAKTQAGWCRSVVQGCESIPAVSLVVSSNIAFWLRPHFLLRSSPQVARLRGALPH